MEHAPSGLTYLIEPKESKFVTSKKAVRNPQRLLMFIHDLLGTSSSWVFLYADEILLY